MGSLLLLCCCLVALLIPIQALVDINVATANDIHSNLNRTTSPCTNFWNFACGGFSSASEYVDNFERVEDQFASAMVEFMESHLGENDTLAPRLIGQMRLYYKACTADARTLHGNPRPEELVNHWTLHPKKFLVDGLNGVFIDERVDVAANDSMGWVVQIKMPDPSAKYSDLRVLQLMRLYEEEWYTWGVFELVEKMHQLQAEYRAENPLVYTWSYSELRRQIPIPHSFFIELLGGNHTEEFDRLTFEVSDVEYLRECFRFLRDFSSEPKDTYIRARQYVLLEESEPRERNPRSCIHHMRAYLPLGMNYIYDRFIYQNREQDTQKLQEILSNLKATFRKYLDANRLQLTPDQLAYVREKLKGIQIKIGNLPEEKFPEFYNNHYRSANFTMTNFLANLLEALALRTRLQNAGLLERDSRVDLRHYYVNDNVRKARTSPFYENERNTITVPMEFLQWPLFDHRQHAIFQHSLLGAVMGHEMNHAFEQEGILFDAAGNESPVGLEIRESQTFRDALKCAEQPPFVSLKERLADLNGLQLAYDSFFGLDHDSRKFEYRPYTFERQFTAPQLFHLSYAQFFCGSLPPVIAHDRDDERVNVSVGNLRQFAYDFNCETSHSTNCEMWRPREEASSNRNVHP
ncbi:neprilysin-1 [Drosophila yakuba]|uniref:Peptidase M13 C-terminal domain-containing protein n=1 Tax=Drosophila yakuba TaxID=7245 RepID=B4P593_DROYA|nr:neprilysin-1 [Drosophila yakuba]EDW90755.1 uncharacterized protein Dyak_GE12469 [Drosophila yakuba]